MIRLQRKPERATYFDHPADLLYDPRLDLRVQYEHIVNNRVDWFPESLRADERRRTESVWRGFSMRFFESSRITRPLFRGYRFSLRAASDPGKLQLLLPVCLVDASGVYRAAVPAA